MTIRHFVNALVRVGSTSEIAAVAIAKGLSCSCVASRPVFIGCFSDASVELRRLIDVTPRADRDSTQFLPAQQTLH